MKKLITALFFVTVFCGTAFSEELVIKLRSGNSISIKYTGTIQDITFHGDSDAITGIVLPQGITGIAPHRVEQPGPEAAAARPAEPEETKENRDSKKKGWFRLKWAEPKDE